MSNWIWRLIALKKLWAFKKIVKVKRAENLQALRSENVSGFISGKLLKAFNSKEIYA